jgi:hypothetical protein
MGLAEIQRALARLYTDATLRERYFADPAALGETLGLDVDDARQLARLSSRDLTIFADSLRRKRLGEVWHLLPLTRRALGPRMATWFWQFTDTYVPRGIHKHQDDALAFSRFLEHAARRGELEPEWAADLARFEAARLRTLGANGGWTMRRFRYPVADLAKSLARDAPPPVVSPRPNLAIWIRFRPSPTPYLIVLRLPRLR